MNLTRRDGTLTLSDNTAIESVLTDIPFFCVGIMTFGISTFLLVVKRVTLLGICLYISSLLAFAASIFDLVQILQRDSSNVSGGIALNTVSGLINTREIALALSLAFRYIFYWAFVSEEPRKQIRPIRSDRTYDPRYDSHGNSWQRWGYLGFFLKWSLLGLTVTVPILQIIWRIAQREYGTIYMVDATMEIVTSALYIFKIFLNIYLATDSPWWRTLLSYLAPTAALSISLGLSVGQLIFFDLVDTTLGRFLQAIELYTLIVYWLIVVFLPGSPPPRPPRSPSLPFQSGLNEKDGLRFTLPRPGIIPNPPAIAGCSPKISVINRDDPISAPIWDLPAKPFLAFNLSNTAEPDLERGANLGTKEQISSQSSPAGPPQPDGAPKDVSELVPSSTVLPQNVPQIVATPAPSPPFDDNIELEGRGAEQSGRSTTVSFASYYMQDRSDSSIPLPPSFSRTGNESPVYGLNGIIGTPRPESSLSLPRTIGTTRSSATSFSELLRQQNDLDKSIAALRLFSPQPSSVSFTESQPSLFPGPQQPLEPQPPFFTRKHSVATSSSSGTKGEPPSAKSEFSLSVFPEPPELSTPAFTSLSSPPKPVIVPSQTRISPATRSIPSDVSATQKDSLYDIPSIPVSPNQPGPGHGRFDSAGTQYDVTSFIGDLTDPSLSGLRSDVFKGSSGDLSDVESGDESPVIATATLARSVSTVVVGSRTRALASPEDEAESDKTKTLRPFFLGNVTSSPIVSSPLSGQPLSTRRSIPGRIGLSGTYRHRLKISQPKNASEGLDNPGDYERPRPPPLIIYPVSGGLQAFQ